MAKKVQFSKIRLGKYFVLEKTLWQKVDFASAHIVRGKRLGECELIYNYTYVTPVNAKIVVEK